MQSLKLNEGIGSAAVGMVVLRCLGDLYVLNEPRQAVAMYRKSLQFAHLLQNEPWIGDLKAKILDVEMI